MKKKLCTLLLCLCSGVLAVSLLSGCSKKGIKSTTSGKMSSDSQVHEKNYNPLTGLDYRDEAMKGKRPICLMINNHKKAWPQNGISQADIIYEAPVEGGLTRLLAVFGDYGSVEKFGSVRSARHDFVELALPFHPVFIHWGGSHFAYTALENSSLDTIDGNMSENKYFFTDKSLKRALEHTRFLLPEKLDKAISDKNYDLTGETPDAFQFAEEQDSIRHADTAAEVSVTVSKAIQTTFSYDSAAGDYTKKEYGEDTLDGNTKEKVHIKNVFVLYDSIPLMSDGEHVDLSLSSGSGYYITNGTRTEINWAKGDKDSMLKFQLASGGDVKVNPGNSWVLFVPHDMKEKTTFA